ncbi:MAG: hypothetical protein IKR13_02605, partial [Victivallales bacterium]|nr:hypothetical protein [Victivallales bacterium]
EAAARGEAVNLAAVLPPDAEESDYDFAWSAVPEVEFTDNGITASFAMPAGAVTVNCIVIERNTASRRTIQLLKGWNLVALSLSPDAESLAKLREFTVWTLDSTQSAYVQNQEFSPYGIYWLYASAPRTLVLTGEAVEVPVPKEEDCWQPFGTYPANHMQNFNVWKWEDEQFVSQPDSQIEPGRGYFIRRSN